MNSGEKEISGRFDFYESFDFLKNKEFKNITFKNCTFENVLFYRSNLKFLRFEKCILDECDFQNTNNLPVFIKSTVGYTTMIEV